MLVIASTANAGPARRSALALITPPRLSPSQEPQKSSRTPPQAAEKSINYFCPQCGSTVYWKLSNLPALIGVAVGAMANPKYPAPVISVEEQTKHDWVHIDGAVEHFQQSYLPKKNQTEPPPTFASTECGLIASL